MKEHPILFSTPMVQAILAGRKTQTRRIIKPQPIDAIEDDGNFYEGKYRGYVKVDGHPDWQKQFATEFAPWQPGNFLYVREEYFRFGCWIEAEGEFTKTGKQKWKFIPTTCELRYTDNPPNVFAKGKGSKPLAHNAWYKRLARFMPKGNARIWLEITDIKMERLQDISNDDAISEGIEFAKEGPRGEYNGFKNYFLQGEDYKTVGFGSSKRSFKSLWLAINGAPTWEQNPWVWAVSFKVLSTTGKPVN